MRTRRLAPDYERRTTSAEAMVYWSMSPNQVVERRNPRTMASRQPRGGGRRPGVTLAEHVTEHVPRLTQTGSLGLAHCRQVVDLGEDFEVRGPGPPVLAEHADDLGPGGFEPDKGIRVELRRRGDHLVKFPARRPASAPR
jgi:hypothetical protein